MFKIVVLIYWKEKLDIGINTVRQYLQDGLTPQEVSDDLCLKSLYKEIANLYINESDDLVYRRNLAGVSQVLIPKSWVPQIIVHFHGAPLVGHTSPLSAYTKAKQYCFWPGMKLDFENHSRTCAQCQKFSKPNPPYHAPLQSIQTDHPFKLCLWT